MNTKIINQESLVVLYYLPLSRYGKQKWLSAMINNDISLFVFFGINSCYQLRSTLYENENRVDMCPFVCNRDPKHNSIFTIHRSIQHLVPFLYILSTVCSIYRSQNVELDLLPSCNFVLHFNIMISNYSSNFYSLSRLNFLCKLLQG